MYVVLMDSPSGVVFLKVVRQETVECACGYVEAVNVLRGDDVTQEQVS